MKAILIDPFAITADGGQPSPVTEIDIGPGIDEIYKALSHETHPVDCFTCVGLGNGDVIFVDDDGLANNVGRWFCYGDYPQPLSGRGLILGTDRDGESVSPVTTLAQARNRALTGWHDVQVDGWGHVDLLPALFAWHYREGVRCENIV